MNDRKRKIIEDEQVNTNNSGSTISLSKKVKSSKHDDEIEFIQNQLMCLKKSDKKKKVKKEKNNAPKLVKEKPLSSKEKKRLRQEAAKAERKKLNIAKMNKIAELTEQEKSKLESINVNSSDIEDIFLILKAQKNIEEQVVEKDEKEAKTLCQKIKPLSKKKTNKLMRGPVAVNEDSTDTSDYSTDDSDSNLNINEIIETCNDADATTYKESKAIDVEEIVPDKVQPIITKETVIEIPTVKPKPAVFELVDRDPKIIEFRNQLPIIEHEMDIMSAVSENDIIVITGATGSGKTTQVPQFLYEGGYARDGKTIGITEPRRVAAVSMARRVKEELNIDINSADVGYHIRFDKQSNLATKIKFMTDGVLLQELKHDISLNKYSVIVIDEAHERSMHTDLLIGTLKIIIKYRRAAYQKQLSKKEAGDVTDEKEIVPLKLIIMSATLRIDDFVKNPKLFESPPPVIKVDGRQYKVNIKFNKHTATDYLVEAYNKAVEIHRTKNHDGSILIFVTSQSEVELLCRWLSGAFPVTDAFLKQQEANKEVSSLSANQKRKKLAKENQIVPDSLPITLKDFSVITNDEEMELYQTSSKPVEDIDEEEIDGEDDYFEDDTITNFDKIQSGCYFTKHCNHPMHVLPLFSMLSPEKQKQIWEPVPDGQRMVIVATNVAETSITIPSVRYVIDCGMEKVKTWDPKTGLSRFMISRISKSSAEQRSGRAGRVQDGECYRLYSSAVYERFEDYPPPEVLRRPVDDVILDIRVLFASVHLKFKNSLPQLPSMPSAEAILNAEKQLILLGALTRLDGNNTKLTTLGKKIAAIPLIPRISKMLVKACEMKSNNMLRYTILMVSILTVPNIFLISKHDADDNTDSLYQKSSKAEEFKRSLVKKPHCLLLGDITTLIGSIIMLDNTKREHGTEFARKFAIEREIRWKGFEEVMEHQKNLIKIISQNDYFPNTNKLLPEDESSNLIVDCKGLTKPSMHEFEMLRKLILVGSSINVANKCCGLEDIGHTQKDKKKNYSRKVLRDGYKLANGLKGPVFIHRTSVVYDHKFDWVVYQDLIKSEVHKSENEALSMMKIVSAIEPEWLALYCPHDCHVDGLFLDKSIALQGANEQEKEALLSFLPKYDYDKDLLLGCAKRLMYGENKLLLPYGTRIKLTADVLRSVMTTTQRDSIESFVDKTRKWFLRFFLEGIVLENSKMSDWRSYFISTYKPEMLNAPVYERQLNVSSLMREAQNLVKFNRQELLSIWNKDPNFLLSSYLKWIKPEFHKEVVKCWPPV